jgi:hypothetical protein
MKRLCGEHDAQRVEERVKNSDLISARRQIIDLELPEGISLDRSFRPFDYDIGVREVPAIQAVDDNADDLRLTGLGGGRRRR